MSTDDGASETTWATAGEVGANKSEGGVVAPALFGVPVVACGSVRVVIIFCQDDHRLTVVLPS